MDAMRGPSADQIGRVLARLEEAPLEPPPELVGAARALFVELARANRLRRWNASHATMLADYCRVVVSWRACFDVIDAAHGLGPNGKVHPLFAVLNHYSRERLRLSRLIGLASGSKDIAYENRSKSEERARHAGAVMAKTLEGPNGDLLA